MKVLVLVGKYPDPDGHLAQHFIHVRNVAYRNSGIDVTVLCFSAKANYVYDGISVITLDEFKRRKDRENYDVAIFQQPNLRYHFRFVLRYGRLFKKYIWFFHGQEALRVEKVYPIPYPYIKKPYILRCFRDIYDVFKLFVWRNYLPHVISKSRFVFVSKYIADSFFRWTKIPVRLLKGKYEIVYNGIGKAFEEGVFSYQREKSFDFITIRHTLDWSHCCLDYINELAKRNPSLKFLVIGKGAFFSHYQKASNITWENTTLRHEEVLDRLQDARCALMPTRQDTQGLMMCEMASIGMPVITSDIPVCHEVFGNFENVTMIKNDDLNVDLKEICVNLEKKEPYTKNEKYFSKNTGLKEVELIQNFLLDRW